MFDDCKFNFGRNWGNNVNLTGYSHVSVWLGECANYNQYWEGEMINAAKNAGVTPVIYAYVIAYIGKLTGLKDCDCGTPSHCTDGANIIRNKWSCIINRYKNYAQGIACDYSITNPTIWLIEPDYLQYSVTGSDISIHGKQNGGGIPDADLGGKYFNEIVSAIKQYLPNAKIAVDISPWLNDKITTWYNNFDKGKVDYLFTSGGRTQGGNTRIRLDNNNNVTWAQASSAMGGKKIIADCGYGIGGVNEDDYEDWMNTTNVRNRMNEGVIGLTIHKQDSL